MQYYIPTKGGNMKKYKILIVEDEPIIALNLQEILFELGAITPGVSK